MTDSFFRYGRIASVSDLAVLFRGEHVRMQARGLRMRLNRRQFPWVSSGWNNA